MKQKRNMGKEVKDVGVLLIVIGCIMLAIIVFGLASSNTTSFIGEIIDEHSIFLVVGGLISALLGIVIRSIGRTKELKFNAENANK